MNANEPAEIGVIVGRFQTPFLHEGHLEIIKYVTEKHPRVFVFLGQSPLKCTQNDPLDFNTRRAMLEDAFPDVEVHRIDDVGSDSLWTRELDRQIGLLAGPNQQVILYGSRDSFLRAYKGHYPTEELKASRYVSATEIRKRMGVKSKKSQAFREGAVWAMQNQYPKIYATVDMAVVNMQKKEILLGKKPSDILWRFPGGFSDIIGSSFDEDAQRELVEETHLVATELVYVGSRLIDDWRYRNQVDKIKTIFFAVTGWDGEAKAGDDLSEVRWFPLIEVKAEMFVPNHGVLFNMFTEWFRRQSLNAPILKSPECS